MFMIYERSMNKPCKVTIKDNEATFEPQKTIKTATCFPDKMYKDFEKILLRSVFYVCVFQSTALKETLLENFTQIKYSDLKKLYTKEAIQKYITTLKSR